MYFIWYTAYLQLFQIIRSDNSTKSNWIRCQTTRIDKRYATYSFSGWIWAMIRSCFGWANNRSSKPFRVLVSPLSCWAIEFVSCKNKTAACLTGKIGPGQTSTLSPRWTISCKNLNTVYILRFKISS